MSGEEKKKQWRYRHTQGEGAVMSSLPVPIPRAIIIKIHTFKGGVLQVEGGGGGQVKGEARKHRIKAIPVDKVKTN